jgi:predicted nucleic acid-binding protein
MSAITVLEVLEGIPRSRNPQRAEQRFRSLSQRVPVLAVDEAVAVQCAQLRQLLRGQGRSLRPRALDLLIAATALHYGLDLVTNNPHDFRDVPGVTILDAAISP